jgi:RNA polymerase sigma-70 factor, ECF subfamily
MESERRMPEDQTAWREQLKTGDEEAVRAMVREYGASLVRFLAGMTCSRADAEDLAQEAFIRVVKHASQFRGDSSLKTYLFRIAQNLACNYLTSPARRHEVQFGEMPDGPALGPAPLQEASLLEEAAHLRRTLLRLPPQQRAVVILRTWHDLSFREIASVMSLAEGTAKAHYFFGIKGLRRILEAPHDPR